MEIEVRLLVPELHGRIAQLGERLSYKQEVAGSTPALPTPRARRRIAQAAERLSDMQEAAGSTPAPPTPCGRSSAVERSSETRGGAGSIPAGHTFGFVAQQEEPPTLNRCGAGSTPAGATHGRAAMGAVPRLENGWPPGLGGSTPSPSASWRHGREAEGGAVLTRRRVTVRRFESCCLRSFRCSRDGKTRDC